MSDPPPIDRPGPKKGGGRIRASGVKYAVVIEVDGVRLDLKEFLHDVGGGSVDGLWAGLRGVDAPRRIRVDVERL